MIRFPSRSLVLELGLVLGLAPTLALGAGCGEDEDAEIPAASAPGSASAEVTIEAPEPEHEGTVVVVGDRYPVEVVTHESGQVYAYFVGDEPPEAGDLELTVEVPTRGRQTGRPVRMRYNARQGRWVGRVRRLEIVPGPIDVVVVHEGARLVGHVDIIVVAPAIQVHVVDRPRIKYRHKGKRRGRRHGRHGRGGVEVRFR